MTAIIFDIDGVVLDSPHELTWRKALKKLGVKGFTSEIYNKTAAGVSRKFGAERILKEMKVFESLKIPKNKRDELVQKLCDYKQEFLDESIEKGEIKIFKSTVDMLREATVGGIKTIAASSSKNAKRMLLKVGVYELFDFDILGIELKHGKPAPDIFLLAAKAAGVKPKDCIVIEDVKAGVEAAKAAGMFCVGVASHGYRNGLQGADLIVNDLSEVTLDDLLRKKNEKL